MALCRPVHSFWEKGDHLSLHVTYLGSTPKSSILIALTNFQVYGLIRHGTRYPTPKHLARWKALQQSLPDKLRPNSGGEVEWGETANKLLQWTNPLYQDIADSKAGPTDLTLWGMKELFCLGKRLRERFTEIPKKYSSLWYDFRSTVKTRAVQRYEIFLMEYLVYHWLLNMPQCTVLRCGPF